MNRLNGEFSDQVAGKDKDNLVSAVAAHFAIDLFVTSTISLLYIFSYYSSAYLEQKKSLIGSTLHCLFAIKRLYFT